MRPKKRFATGVRGRLRTTKFPSTFASWMIFPPRCQAKFKSTRFASLKLRRAGCSPWRRPRWRKNRGHLLLLFRRQRVLDPVGNLVRARRRILHQQRFGPFRHHVVFAVERPMRQSFPRAYIEQRAVV